MFIAHTHFLITTNLQNEKAFGGGKFGNLVSRKMGKNVFEHGQWSKKEGWREADGILEGVSSLHSWIKNQTVIPPTTKMSHIRSTYDEVNKFFLLYTLY